MEEVRASEFRITANAVAIRMAVECFEENVEQALEGRKLFSLETNHKLDRSTTIVDFILNNPQCFIALAKDLPPLMQDIIFQYYFLGRAQTQIGQILGTNQDTVWRGIVLATKALCAKACKVRPQGIKKVWSDMEVLQRRRHKDRTRLKLDEPPILGKFKVKLTQEAFEDYFVSASSDGSIVRWMEC